ncbi:NAD(P)H-dependent oxidoreductase [Actinobaculum sp. 352]|uniref:FMN-dependent NADH-azoreductase n=1 Tax=Actinobaculum sp. 352 TaxID=2490946 RepID=UPI000F7DDF82|nr:NAD(P)H-dependent oxidoreductase [Actinobaculum sp. 352]RTE49220.1 FMN-dependent NADH-azoreductase [Actinobaculum sp. 352]
MARVLIVRSHPLDARASRTMRLTAIFEEEYRKHHPKDEITNLNLYEVAIPEIDLDLLNGWNELGEGVPFIHLSIAEQAKITLFKHYTEQFVAADKVVIANPLWNLQVPTRLKAWIDTINVVGVTFRYNDDGTAISLVPGKKILHIQTAGGIFRGADPANQYLRTIFGFLGVQSFEEIVAEGMDFDPEHAEEIMNEAAERALLLGQSF